MVDLGYVVHTPAELFGTREAAMGASDELWLEKVAKIGWAVLNRDIEEREAVVLDASGTAGADLTSVRTAA